jgi:prepilin-type N-terminal cleavage/methylation domain-containing protein
MNCQCEVRSDDAIQRECRARLRRARRDKAFGRLGARSGFTLLELLVAATITAVLAGFIVLIVSNVAGVWTRTTNRLSADAQARYILDQLALDLSSAQFRDDGNVWFAANVNDNTSNSGLWQAAAANGKPSGTNSLQMTATNLSDARFGQSGVWLRFFTTRRGANDASSLVNSVNTASAPIAVGYQLVRRFTAATATGTAGSSTAYLFHRVEVRPAASGTGSAARPGVLEAGYNITAAAYTTTSATNSNGGQAGDTKALKVITTNARDFTSVIGANVIDFGVRCYVRDSTKPSGLRLVFPATDATGTTISNASNARILSSLPSTTPATSANFNQVMPDVVDVMVRILTDDGARLITLFEQSGTPLTLPTGVNAQAYWWQLALANSQVFTRRIVLNAQPL